MNRIDERERHLRQHLVDRHCDYSAEELRTHARRSKDVSQSRRLLSLAVRDGMDRAAAVKIGGMDRQMLRDWVHRFNVSGPEGLIDNRTEGLDSGAKRNAVKRSGFERPFQARQVRLGMAS
jgi:hypothetical protein